ncbi:MAG: dienelactone hydrolase family protein [Planctomycetes bacterium]|nr:dienelactone hydrolase family protein [Planctomycetota bacterium]
MRFFIAGPVGRLEAHLWLPNAGSLPRAAAVVCHPHPVAGGTMDNNVVFRTSRGLQSAGLAVLRFNFRSAGKSEGLHHGEGAEEDDVVAALEHLERAFPGLPLWAAGFSFGSRTVGSLARREPRIARVCLVAPPSRAYDCRFLREVRQPMYIQLAEHDEFGTPSDFRERVGDLGSNVELDVIPGVDHFFRGRTPELEARVRAWAERSLASP